MRSIKHTPMSQLTCFEHYQIELQKELMAARECSNRLKENPSLLEFEHTYCYYLIGRLHGVVYGFASMLIYAGSIDLYEESEIFTASAINEANFLLGPYIQGAYHEQ